MDLIISILAAEGIPAGIFYLILRAMRLRGREHLTAMLSSLNSGGMIGGILSLLVMQALVFLITKVIVERIYTRCMNKLIKNGCLEEEILRSICRYHITRTLKKRLIYKFAVQTVIETIKNEGLMEESHQSPESRH